MGQLVTKSLQSLVGRQRTLSRATGVGRLGATIGKSGFLIGLIMLAGLAFARLLRLDAVQAGVMMAFAAVPTASSAYVLAARMGYNGPFVAGLVTLSTLLGVLSLPFALALLPR